MAAIASIITSLSATAITIIDKLFPSHVKDFIHKMSCKSFDSTMVYTDKNVDLEGVKTTSVLTADLLKNVSEYNEYDVSVKTTQATTNNSTDISTDSDSMKASNDVVKVNKAIDKVKQKR